MQIFINFTKFFKSLWWVHFCWMFPPEPKFWWRHCSTELEWNSCMKFCPNPSPNQNPGVATAYTRCTSISLGFLRDIWTLDPELFGKSTSHTLAPHSVGLLSHSSGVRAPAQWTGACAYRPWCLVGLLQ